MSWSLGEIGALSTKAARGCGMDWGLADEAGYAVKWLQRRQLPGIAALCRYLSWRQTGEITAWPDVTGDQGHYCPIATGAAYGDGLFGDEVEFSRMRTPLLLIPFIALRADITPIAISLETVVFSLSQDGFAYSGNDTAILTAASHCRISTKIDHMPPLTRISDTDLPRVPETAAACVTVLNSFAKNTYAPATEASRLAGAGAGLSDND
ncbi:DUF3726 domain-containing protein [Alphaproteobacteria bacterium LSUCC0226]|jgi:hypothetical protein|nr:DUF3726 domain-containing protein [Alphaproteobacteria bacterium]